MPGGHLTFGLTAPNCSQQEINPLLQVQILCFLFLHPLISLNSHQYTPWFHSSKMENPFLRENSPSKSTQKSNMLSRYLLLRKHFLISQKHVHSFLFPLNLSKLPCKEYHQSCDIFLSLAASLGSQRLPYSCLQSSTQAVASSLNSLSHDLYSTPMDVANSQSSSKVQFKYLLLFKGSQLPLPHPLPSFFLPPRGLTVFTSST